MLNDLPIAIKEALAYHESLCRMGFAAADISVQYTVETGSIVVKIQHAGLSCPAHQSGLSPQEFKAQWADAVTAWNKVASERERQMLWEVSVVRKNVGLLIAFLLDAGVVIPGAVQGSTPRQ